MKSRRKSREACLQALYQIDALEEWNRECVELYFSVYQKPEELLASSKENYQFSLSLIHGVLDNLDFLDTSITGASTHWSIARMCRVDRNILRLSTFEIGFVADIPISVSINEGIELAKLYGSDDSPMFVNGVLDNVARSFLGNPKLAHIVPLKERKKLVVNE